MSPSYDECAAATTKSQESLLIIIRFIHNVFQPLVRKTGSKGEEISGYTKGRETDLDVRMGKIKGSRGHT